MGFLDRQDPQNHHPLAIKILMLDLCLPNLLDVTFANMQTPVMGRWGEKTGKDPRQLQP